MINFFLHAYIFFGWKVYPDFLHQGWFLIANIMELVYLGGNFRHYYMLHGNNQQNPSKFANQLFSAKSILFSSSNSKEKKTLEILTEYFHRKLT